MGVRDAAEFLTMGLTQSQLKLLRDIGWRMLVSFHMAYACGYLALMGLPLAGFAHAEDVKGVAAEIREDRVERIELAIFDTRRSQCTATTREAKITYGERVTELASKYRKITGQYPRIPLCDEV